MECPSCKSENIRVLRIKFWIREWKNEWTVIYFNLCKDCAHIWDDDIIEVEFLNSENTERKEGRNDETEA